MEHIPHSEEQYHGDLRDDEHAPKHPRHLMNGAFVPLDEVASAQPNPEEALMAREDDDAVEEEEEEEESESLESAPFEGDNDDEPESRDAVMLQEHEGLEEPPLPAHSGSIAREEELSMGELNKKHPKTFRSNGPRGNKPEYKDKRP